MEDTNVSSSVLLARIDSLEKEVAGFKSRATRERYNNILCHTIIEKSSELIAMVDENGRIIFAAPSVFRILGYTAEELTTLHFSIIVEDEDKKTLTSLFEEVLKTPEETFRIKAKLKHKSGKIIWCHGTGTNKLRVPDINAVVIQLQDITFHREKDEKLSESEEKFRRIAESIQDIFWMSDINENKVYYISPAFESVWERTPQSLYDDPGSITESIVPEDRERFLESIMNQSNGKEYSIEYRIQTPSGKVKHILDRGFPVYDDNHQLVRFVGVARDITLSKKYEERILQINEELERKVLERTNELSEANLKLNELNATKDKFFSIIAHDLINPFNSILNFSRLLLRTIDKKESPTTQKWIKDIYHSAENAYELLDNLLDWARTQTGRIEFRPAKYHVKGIINNAIESVNSIAIHKKITINCICDDISVQADQNMIETVLRNFITNAIKFSEPGSEILVKGCTVGSEVAISVIDHGTGMSPVLVSKLFKINEKTHMPGTSQEPGSGLGLILCKEFIDMHNGRICVESQPGFGSTFQFFLPVV